MKGVVNIKTKTRAKTRSPHFLNQVFYRATSNKPTNLIIPLVAGMPPAGCRRGMIGKNREEQRGKRFEAKNRNEVDESILRKQLSDRLTH